jgi:penicillin G amidase
LPQLDGRIAVSGPTHELRIARDADGVPLIDAANDEDAAFGLGFAHAQDRLFQMDMQRRYGAGRLAEIFGPQALATDRQMRVLGIYRAAEAELPYLLCGMCWRRMPPGSTRLWRRGAARCLSNS